MFEVQIRVTYDLLYRNIYIYLENKRQPFHDYFELRTSHG